MKPLRTKPLDKDGYFVTLLRVGGLLACSVLLCLASLGPVSAAEEPVPAQPRLRAPKKGADSAAPAPADTAAKSVTLQASARAYRPGDVIVLELNNAGSTAIYLPGCASYTLERFQEEHFVPLPLKRCDWEQNALLVPPGSRRFELPAPEGTQAIVRAVVTYGVDCREGIPLSRAACKRIETVASPSFLLLPEANE